MNILVSGSSGLIGSALVPFVRSGGHRVVRLVRSRSRRGSDEISWDPDNGRLDRGDLEGFEAVVHLAGVNIAAGRWTVRQKARIRDSRAKGTRLLSEALAGLAHPPQVLVSASAVGYYGDRGQEILKEESAPGTDFLAGVCREWEAATQPAAARGVRVVNTRFGMVLSASGGALPKMLTPFRLGLGGVVGSGRQYMPWIALDDVVGVVNHALKVVKLGGAINTVAPQAITNREFTKTLGRVLSRPTVFPVPAFMARLALGEMADALLLSSQRVEPARLLEAGYGFRYPELEGALRHVLRSE